MPEKDELVNLVQVIRDNPGCIATIDNDCWWINPAPPKPTEEMDDEEFEQWHGNIIAHSDGIIPLGDDGYGSGRCYGGDILQALAMIVGIEIRSV